jgi:1,4-alpha-glucan branching enzyme
MKVVTLRVVLLCAVGSASFLRGNTGSAQSGLDNAALVPRWVPNERVTMEGMSPDWVKTLIIVQCRVEMATPEGTFRSAGPLLNHYAEMGVNGLWLTPIFTRTNPQRNGYLNHGPHTIDPQLTGTNDTEESFKVVKAFVAEAHRKNIRVFSDIIVWGTAKDAPLVSEHPDFYRKNDGRFVDVWGGYAFDWRNQEFREWFKHAAVAFIEKTDADGFRVDLAPDTSGYFFKEVRDALYTKGRKIAIISEMTGERRDTFDFEQIGVHGWTEKPDWQNPEKLAQQKRTFGLHNEYLFHKNIVEVIKSGARIGDATLQQQGKGGTYRFYTSNLLCHDDSIPFVRGNRVRFGYSSILAPMIPLWFVGEEWNNPKTIQNVMYFNVIDWSAMDQPANRAFYEDVKAMIRVRRSYPDLFENFPENHRDSNICKVAVRENLLQSYARYAKGRAVLVIPNSGPADTVFDATIPFADMGLDAEATYQISDAITGDLVTRGRFAEDRPLKVATKKDHLSILLVERFW